MLLSCNPFGNCVWVTADGFTAARTKLTTVADDALPPLSPSPSSSTNSQLTSSTTSQQQSVWLAEGMTPTTTQATLQTAQAPSTLGGFGSSTTQPLTAETSSNPVQASSLPDSTNSTGVSDWNVNGESETPAEGAIPIGMSPIGNPDPSEPVTTEATIQGDYSINNQTNDSLSSQLKADEPQIMSANNDSVRADEWNVDESVFSMSDDPTAVTSALATETSTKGRTDNPNRNTSGPENTEEPWNIDSFLTNYGVQNNNGQSSDLNNGKTDNGQTDNGQPTDFNNWQTDNGQPSDLNNGQTDNGQPTDFNNWQTDNGQPSDFNNGQTDNGQPTDSNNGQTDNGQPTDLNNGQIDNEQPTDYNSNGTDPSYEDPWTIDPWLLSKINDLKNNEGQATDSDNKEPNDNGQTDDDLKNDFGYSDDNWPQPDSYNKLTTRSNAGGDDNQPEDDYQQQQQQQQEHQFNDVIDPQPIDEWQSPIIDAPAPLNPDDETSLEEPVFVPEERPREMKRTFIQSPGIIIGLCSALGVAFLVLLAVCRKVYLSHDRPRYKPLRDYDIRFEPPAASSALLP